MTFKCILVYSAVKPGLSAWVWEFRWSGPGDIFFCFVAFLYSVCACVVCNEWETHIYTRSLLYVLIEVKVTWLGLRLSCCFLNETPARMHVGLKGWQMAEIASHTPSQCCVVALWKAKWCIWTADSKPRPCVSCVSLQGCHQPRVRARWSFTCWTTTTTPPTWSRQWRECVKTHTIWMWP